MTIVIDCVHYIACGSVVPTPSLSRLETIHQFLDWLMLPLAKALLARLETGQFPFDVKLSQTVTGMAKKTEGKYCFVIIITKCKKTMNMSK